MKVGLWLSTALVVFTVSCSSTQITHSWKAQNIPTGQYKKILVVALNGEKDMRARQGMEDHLAGDLATVGYHTLSSLREFGPKSFEGMNDDQVISKLQNSGIDAVLTIVLLDKSREKYYYPDRIFYSPYVIYQGHFPGYYSTMSTRIYSPGYYTVNTRYFWESNFYNVTSKELLYSVQTESFDPASTDKLAHEYGKMIVDDMVKNKVLVKKEDTAKRPGEVNKQDDVSKKGF